MKDNITIDRSDLYKEVWQTPMTRLAKKYGISDNGLRKICKKLNIPLPGSGYWMKIKHGKKVRRARLPKLKEGEPQSHTIYAYDNKGDDFELGDEAQNLINKVLNVEKRIEVPDRITHYHGLSKEARKAFKKEVFDERGMLYFRRGYLDIRVSRNQFNKALKIFDTLLKGFKKFGIRVSNDKEPEAGTFVHMFGEKVRVYMKEKTKPVPHVPTKEEIKDNKRHPELYPIPEWDHAPNGELSFQILSYDFHRQRKKWTDGKIQRVGNMINEIIAGTIRVAESKRQNSIEAEERRCKWEKEREENEKRRKKINELEKHIEQWEKSQRIRNYIKAVEKIFVEGKSDNEISDKIKEYILFAKNYADYFDPLVSE